MRNRDIQNIERVVVDEITPRIGQSLQSRDLPEPLSGRRIEVGDGDDGWAHRVVDEMKPASTHSGELAAHQPAADDADAHVAHAISFSASSTEAFSWSIAISARVMPAGLACWTMLRP